MRRLPLRSPPRMRGKVWLHQKPGRVPGITPAYAGKSPPAKRKNPAIWDHPRVCGEKIPSSLNWPMFLGSPPRVRGKADSANLHQPKPGITPAYAGKSTGLCEHSRQEQDHPRVCGEKSAASIWAICARGSPPRMRGKELSVSAHCHICGITPAYAGKSEAVNGPGIAGKDHPRVCGEKRVPPLIGFVCTGSPPRMRGKEYRVKRCSCNNGITPAYAGKRRQAGDQAHDGQDHPRVCGEKFQFRPVHRYFRGSPPRMRGKECNRT